MDEKTDNDGTGLLTVAEAARRLRIEPKTLYRMLADGRFPGRRIGRLWRVAAAEIERLEQAR